MKIGLIQTIGMGDIIIALPIAKFFHEQGNEIFWPILEEFLPSFKSSAPWVNWIGISRDARDFFYQTPLDILSKINAEKIIILYNYMYQHKEIPNKLLQRTLKFDQYKYAISEVPFDLKWNLESCILRNENREMELYTKLVKKEDYMVIQQNGSNFERQFDLTEAHKKGQQVIEITKITDNIFDWLTVIERAKTLVLIDSVFANLVDQMKFGKNIPKYFAVRSRSTFTPVLLQNWNYF